MIPEEERDKGEIALTNLLEWARKIQSGEYGFTVKDDCGYGPELDEALDTLEEVIDDWYS